MATEEPFSAQAHHCKNQTSMDTAQVASFSRRSQSSDEATIGDVIYTADLKVCATVYIRAINIEEAQKVLATLSYTALYATGDKVGESAFTDCFPDVEIAEGMTIHGQFDGDVLAPRYDLANQIDYG